MYKSHGILEEIVMNKPKIALTIAGTDPSGGAGVMADLKSFHAPPPPPPPPVVYMAWLL
jgi:hypothetical protein